MHCGGLLQQVQHVSGGLGCKMNLERQLHSPFAVLLAAGWCCSASAKTIVTASALWSPFPVTEVETRVNRAFFGGATLSAVVRV
jgi:hypothetical protein